MQHSEAAMLGKWGFLLDLVQLAVGSTIALIILGVAITLFVIVYVVGKVMNVQESRSGAPSSGERESGGAQPYKIDLKK